MQQRFWRGWLLAGWCALPFGAWAYHEGPGQEGLRLDDVDAAVVRAEDAADDADWGAAIDAYEEALKELPTGDEATAETRNAGYRIQIAINQCRLQFSGLVEARNELATLVKTIADDEDADAAVLDQARSAYANAQYYYAYLMRLEGAQADEWEPELEIARQTYRLLAEQADGERQKRHKEDLEATIALARLDLQELQGLPLPGQ